MNDSVALVVTSIASPNDALRALAKGARKAGYRFILIGDQASPPDFELAGCDFYSMERQRQLELGFAQACPTKHYGRKNIGYLLAVAAGASVIIETDDDNTAQDAFWKERAKRQRAATVEQAGWVNIYRYFSNANIWPRGFPLEHLRKQPPAYESLIEKDVDCPIQQSLVDDNPDVDAIYRLTLPLPQKFAKAGQVALTAGSLCPFNSQNTTWFAEAFKLMYLPCYCSFRMTDIWRSFVAQIICHINDWPVLFGEPTMTQNRNVHDLLRDFEQEVPGYLNNNKICEAVAALPLKSGVDNIDANLRMCYDRLVGMSLVGQAELKLLDIWLQDLGRCQSAKVRVTK